MIWRLKKAFLLVSASILVAPWFLILLACSRLLSSRYYIRMAKWKSDRIGHQAADMEAYLRGRLLNPDPESAGKKTIYIFLTEKPANKTLLRLIRRQVVVLSGKLTLVAFDLLKGLFKDSKFFCKSPSHRSIFNEYAKIPPQLSFQPDEIESGERLLSEMGIPEGAPFVCIHSRDKAFLQNALKNEDYSYHDYRDCSISTRKLAADRLAELGIWSVRVGANVADNFDFQNEKVVDYTRHHRSDFGDIYLMSRCKFLLGTTAGLTTVAWSFNTPVIVVNAAPLAFAAMRPGDLFIVKKYWSEKEQRFLHFKEIISMGADEWATSEKFRQNGIRLVENTAEEILDVTLQMNDQLDGRWKPEPEDEMLQDKFRNLWQRPYRFSGYTSRVGAKFLRDNRSLIE